MINLCIWLDITHSRINRIQLVTLISKTPAGTEAFPIPLDENNARSLLNDWLRDADQKHRERKEAREKAQAFTCEHFLHGALPQWSIRTDLTLPFETTFAIDQTTLGSTRLELAYYEGDQLLARGAAIYGQLTAEGIKVRFSNPQVTVERRTLDEPLSLCLLDNWAHGISPVLRRQRTRLPGGSSSFRESLRALATGGHVQLLDGIRTGSASHPSGLFSSPVKVQLQTPWRRMRRMVVG